MVSEVASSSFQSAFWNRNEGLQGAFSYEIIWLHYVMRKTENPNTPQTARRLTSVSSQSQGWWLGSPSSTFRIWTMGPFVGVVASAGPFWVTAYFYVFSNIQCESFSSLGVFWDLCCFTYNCRKKIKYYGGDKKYSKFIWPNLVCSQCQGWEGS